ncbi:MAG: T9SS type A sorting domain-containing protein [Bacteroidota bacterium]
MRYSKLVLLLGLFIPGVVVAQYDGGPGDGFSRRTSIQLDLTGIPVGTRPLYAGGRGDGADGQLGVGGLDGQALSLYAGGRGDGFDRTLTAASLSGQELSTLYAGGPSDGFDHAGQATSLGGTDVAILYSGGTGDGFDQESGTATLNGQVIAGIFDGGPGDGFDQFAFAGGLAGSPLGLYGGGRGDGFDRVSEQTLLNGTSLAQLYGGGQGDGFDRAFYFGAVPLPLRLIRFDAYPEQDYVLIRWQTEDEVATDFFTVEKTKNGRHFTAVGEVEAAGYSEPGERIDYLMKDYHPHTGTSFYRLQTTDLDGTISLSHLVEVQLADQDANWDFLLFPNPNTGRQVGIRPSGLAEGDVLQLEIYDASGRQLLQRQLTSDGSDHQLELQQKLASGSYLVRMTDARGNVRAKLLLVGK